jgi:hypothetical protein
MSGNFSRPHVLAEYLLGLLTSRPEGGRPKWTQRPNENAMPGWFKFVLLALAIAGFVLTIYFLRY